LKTRCHCVQLHQCVAGLSLSPRLRALRDLHPSGKAIGEPTVRQNRK
jgi:hypothetical protein